MIKIRLHGTPEEIARAKEVISDNFVILSISQNYPDRGASVYCRAYLDCVIMNAPDDVTVTQNKMIDHR